MLFIIHIFFICTSVAVHDAFPDQNIIVISSRIHVTSVIYKYLRMYNYITFSIRQFQGICIHTNQRSSRFVLWSMLMPFVWVQNILQSRRRGAPFLVLLSQRPHRPRPKQGPLTRVTSRAARLLSTWLLQWSRPMLQFCIRVCWAISSYSQLCPSQWWAFALCHLLHNLG